VVEKENTLRKDVEKRDISHSELLACSGQKVI
jgi:Asp-tRNA(Asn)/Glu-tRNA(Gln) amidotransferase C subunit